MVLSKAKRQKHDQDRLLALRILRKVFHQNEFLDTALESIVKKEPSSRSWLLDVCAGVLRWKGRIDCLLDYYSQREKPKGKLLDILRMGAYQIVGQEKTPVEIIVSETVDFVRSEVGNPQAAFANGILRKISKDRALIREPRPFKELELAETHFYHWASVPSWMWKKWVSEQGLDWAFDFAQACLARPEIWLRTKEGKSRIRTSEPLNSSDYFVQDPSSQKLVDEVTHFVDPASRVLDLCASPGGKSAGLAWNGFRVVATDYKKRRLQDLRNNLERLAPTQTEVVEYPKAYSMISEMDLVWIDAPCTGSGTLRKHPEIRWLRTEKELADLVRLQSELIRGVWTRMKPGAILVYSVCSVFQEEGQKHFESKDLKPSVKKTWHYSPHQDGGDGFFAVLLTQPQGQSQ